MLTLGDIVHRSVEFVRERHGRPKVEVEYCIADILGLRRLDLYVQYDRPLEASEIQKIRPAIVRLARGEPLAYVQHMAHFYGHTFEVSPDVLIPRPETEILVESARKHIENSSVSSGTLVDVCCGSGCVGISLKALFPKWHVIMSDISSEALQIARRNADRCNVEVEILQGDLLEPMIGRKADIIVANPPYVSTEEYESLDISVKNFEPRMALESGPTGLEIYQRLAADVPKILRSSGLVAVEIGSKQGSQVAELFSFCEAVHIIRDLSGRDRVVSGNCLNLGRGIQYCKNSSTWYTCPSEI